MVRRFAMLAFVAAGCAGDKDTADSGTSDSGTGACPDGVYSGPIEITTHTVGCTGNTVNFDLETKGVTGGGWVFSQETANPTPNWSDTHDMDSVDADTDCNQYDKLHQDLQDADTLADPINDWLRNDSTVFQCDQHYESPGSVMTYAMGVADVDGNLVACVAWGQNVSGMVSGTVDRVNEPDFNLSGCTDMGTMAR